LAGEGAGPEVPEGGSEAGEGLSRFMPEGSGLSARPRYWDGTTCGSPCRFENWNFPHTASLDVHQAAPTPFMGKVELASPGAEMLMRALGVPGALGLNTIERVEVLSLALIMRLGDADKAGLSGYGYRRARRPW